MFAEFVNRADIRMVESGSSSRLAAKTFKGLGVLRHIIRQEFQSNKPPKLGILGFVDNAHTTSPDLFEDAVVRDGLANHVVDVITVAAAVPSGAAGRHNVGQSASRTRTSPPQE